MLLVAAHLSTIVALSQSQSAAITANAATRLTSSFSVSAGPILPRNSADVRNRTSGRVQRRETHTPVQNRDETRHVRLQERLAPEHTPEIFVCHEPEEIAVAHDVLEALVGDAVTREGRG